MPDQTEVLFCLARAPMCPWDPLYLARRLKGDSASPDGWRATPPRPTVGGRLRLARRLGSASPDPQGMRTASLNPRGLGSAPFDGRGTTPLRPTGKN